MKIKSLTLSACIALSLGGSLMVHAQNNPAPQPPPGGAPRGDGPPRGEGSPRGEGRGERGGFRGGFGMESLTPEEQEKYRAAIQKAMQDPKVAAARDKQQAANKELTDAIQAALIAADPSMEAITKKLNEAREKAMQGRGERRRPEGGAPQTSPTPPAAAKPGESAPAKPTVDAPAKPTTDK